MTELPASRHKGMALLVQLEEAGALSPIGLTLAEPDLTYGRYEAIGALLGRMHESLRFAIGDWLRLGEQQFPSQWSQASESLNLSEEARREYLRVSERVPRARRRKDLSWSHHRAVASLEPHEQKRWLREASEQALSHHQLRDALRGEAGVNPPARAGLSCPSCGRAYD